ncbi:unnamed protein product [Trichogramma brassicae]|uniref:Uncharacterized protein n=1 Tax=Trichogramma brassicae TaxID=86971 RepID=A0A6H5ILJ0_9HYME|nr:unnamed protein product [Trichogramma brassicae]
MRRGDVRISGWSARSLNGVVRSYDGDPPRKISKASRAILISRRRRTDSHPQCQVVRRDMSGARDGAVDKTNAGVLHTLKS